MRSSVDPRGQTIVSVTRDAGAAALADGIQAMEAFTGA
jgi:hypothetical protein